MKIIPVIDVLGGRVVHGIQGKRENYGVIRNSTLVNSSNPVKVAGAFKEKLSLKEVYIADLDSIQGKGNNFSWVKKIKDNLNIDIYLDCGIRQEKDLEKRVIGTVDKIVLGTETLSSFKVVEEALSIKGSDNVIVSIDMKKGEVVSCISDLEFEPLEYIVEKFHKIGVNNFIILNLDKVGTMKGIKGISKELKQLIYDIKGLNLFIGGGVDSIRTIEILNKLGVTGVLLATALHKGEIPKHEIQNYDLSNN